MKVFGIVKYDVTNHIKCCDLEENDETYEELYKYNINKNNIYLGRIEDWEFTGYDVDNVNHIINYYVEGTLDNIKDNTGDVTIFAYK